jgi:hypothetical protein
VPSLRTGGGHRLRKELFVKGIRQRWLRVDEVEEALDPTLMSAAERWLFYFSLRSAEVALLDAHGHSLTPDEAVPEYRRGLPIPPSSKELPDIDVPLFDGE